VYRSCKRTSTDEEFLMLRLQVFCLLIGVTAFVSARRQKFAHASLFDQRKMRRNQREQQQRQQQQQQQREQQQLNDETIELASLLSSASGEETVPLNLEVV